MALSLDPIALTGTQQEIVYADGQGTLALGGVAGSGKTLTAAHRAAQLARMTPRRANEAAVLVLCYNQALAQALRTLLQRFPKQALYRIEVRTMHQWCWPYVKHQVGTGHVVDAPTQLQLVREAIRTLREDIGPHPVFRRHPAFFLEEIRLIKGCSIHDEAAYLAPDIDRSGAFPVDEYRLVFAVAQRYSQLLRERGQIDFDDYASLARAARTTARRPLHYDHVIVDEAQDLSSTQLDLVQDVARCSLLVISDPQQAIYRALQRADDRDETADLHMLPISFRTTAQIWTAAARLLPLQSGPLPLRHGPAPTWHRFRWREDEAIFIRTTVEQLLVAGRHLSDIAILARRHEVLQPITAELARRGIEGGDQCDLTITTIHAAKGREFRVVIIAGLVEGVLPCVRPDMDRVAAEQEVALAARQLYVAMTRAGDQLWLTGSEGAPSRFLTLLGLEDAA